MRFANILDGASNTLGLVEARRNVPWTMPEDLPFDPAAPVPALGFLPEGAHGAMLDGSVRFFRLPFDPARYRALVTRDGAEIVQP
jgi:hypothetical protein